MNTWLLNSYLSILTWDWFIWRLRSPHPRVTQHSRTYLHDSERPADPQPHPETVHQVCRLHKQWHQDYVQLKVWYKNNDDNIGGVLNEYLALCVFSNSEHLPLNKDLQQKVLVKMAGCQRRSLLEDAVGHLAAEFPMAASWHCDNLSLQTLIIPSKSGTLSQKYLVSLLRCIKWQRVKKNKKCC